MPRQPTHGAGASGRALSGVAVRPPAPSPLPSLSCPLPPWRYRALRARYNALLVTLYERSTLTLREIAAVAGRTDRAVQITVRALGCRPRNARTCRPGTNVGVRRAGPKPPPPSAAATRRAVADFAGVARELAASAEARAASELQRATARAKRRTARTQSRVMAGTARELTYLAAAMEHTAATQRMVAAKPSRKPSRKSARNPAKASKPRWRPDMRDVQEQAMRQQEARMWEAHQAARRAEAAPLAERTGAEPQTQPRIRRL
jgi:hypothetical protein